MKNFDLSAFVLGFAIVQLIIGISNKDYNMTVCMGLFILLCIDNVIDKLKK